VDLSGVHIPTVTPFAPGTGDVDLTAFGSNLRAWLEHPIAGLVVGGSTGEAVLLDEDERTGLWRAAREAIDGAHPGGGPLLIAGAGAESTRATARLCRSAAAAGADAVLVQPPAFYKGAMTPEALAFHYRAVGDASPVPVIVYQVPLRLSTLDLPTGLVAELARHANVVGVKDSRGRLELVGELVDATRGQDFQVLVGNGALLYAALEAGAVGGILAVANLVPGDCAALFDAWRQGRASEAGRLQERVGPLHDEIVAGMGVPGIKAALDLLGRAGGDPRPPLRPLAEARRAALRERLAAGASIDTPGATV
jgi:4-hydroxy-2-oxoglutarate aldolase